MGTTPTSAPGNSAPHAALAGARRGSARARGFTLVELLVVVALIAIASGVASLALRDPAATQLEREAARLSALLESARAEARASGLAVRWVPTRAVEGEPDQSDGFRFIGLPPPTHASEALPTRWLSEGVRAQVVGATAVRLGPEPLIGAQRIVLQLDDRQVVLGTDGLGPFAVLDTGAAGSPQ
jgi:general secretion pathway protein H